MMASRLTTWDRHNVPKLQILDRKVDNGWVLLHKEVVFGEALDVEHHVGGQLGQAEPPPPSFYVITGVLPIKLLQQVKYGHLCATSPLVQPAMCKGCIALMQTAVALTSAQLPATGTFSDTCCCNDQD